MHPCVCMHLKRGVTERAGSVRTCERVGQLNAGTRRISFFSFEVSSNALQRPSAHMTLQGGGGGSDSLRLIIRSLKSGSDQLVFDSVFLTYFCGKLYLNLELFYLVIFFSSDPSCVGK